VVKHLGVLAFPSTVRSFSALTDRLPSELEAPAASRIDAAGIPTRRTLWKCLSWSVGKAGH
jgi:hypothetical protein